MTQDEVNKTHWGDDANWSTGVLPSYFSKEDSRLFVPRRIRSHTTRSFGQTINHGHRFGGILNLVFGVLPPACLIVLLSWVIANR